MKRISEALKWKCHRHYL